MSRLLFVFIYAFHLHFASAKPKVETFFQGKDVVWGFAFLGTDEVVLTQRSGQLYYYNAKTKVKKKLTAPKVYVGDQAGLLDIKVLKSQGKIWIYLTFSEKYQGQITTSLARGIFNNGKLENLKTIFRAKVQSNTEYHFGSRLAFKDDFIFMTVGDRGKRHLAQKLDNHHGKILRLTLAGKAAPGNPFSSNIKALPEIWSFGHRNPQGIDLHTKTDQLYSCEFGPLGGDELNLIEPGRNYGWPVITYGREYHGPKIGTTHKKGMVQPIVYWTPSISPSGMTFYRGGRYKNWTGNIVLAALGHQHLRRLVIKDNKIIHQEKFLGHLNERFRHVRTGPEGFLYASTDSGKILKIIEPN